MALLFILISSILTSAQTVTWDREAGTGDWSNGINWSGDSEPTKNDALIFPSAIPNNDPIITLPSGAEASTLTFENDYTLTGGSIKVDDNTVTTLPGVTATIDSTIDNNLTKEGVGTLIITGDITDRNFEVNEGILQIGINGTGSGAKIITVGDGGILSGTESTVEDIDVEAGGVFSIGDNGGADDGTYTVDHDLDFKTGSTWLVSVTTPTSRDFVYADHHIRFEEGMFLIIEDVGREIGDIFIIAEYGDHIHDTIDPALITPGWTIDYNYNGLNQIALISTIAVPEPSSFILLCPLLLCGLYARKR